MKKERRNIDLHRANFATCSAQARRIRELLRLRQSEKLRRDYGSDRSRVNRTVRMSADLLIDRTCIETCSASDARETLPCERMREHPRSAVIQHDDVKFVRTDIVSVLFYAGDQRLIRSQTLTRARTRQ
jgi:hypothetical protein